MQSAAPDITDLQGSNPAHVAIVMDGNNRWARREGVVGAKGHAAGEKALHRLVNHIAPLGVIKALTVFAFSSENWRRPEPEVQALMALFMQGLAQRVPELHANNISIRFIGDISRFSPELRQGIADAEALTAKGTAMTLVLAVNYGGQWDMANAARQLAEEVAAGRLTPADITPERMGQHVQMADLPPVDLLVRTGGELRVSNFVLWQAAYAEYVFSDELWPDFTPDSLFRAMDEYRSRQRRFGRTSEQVEALGRA